MVEVEGKGRGVRVKEKVPKGAYVCEYEGEVYPRKECAARERLPTERDVISWIVKPERVGFV